MVSPLHFAPAIRAKTLSFRSSLEMAQWVTTNIKGIRHQDRLLEEGYKHYAQHRSWTITCPQRLRNTVLTVN
jgi:hypothetical protein